MLAVVAGSLALPDAASAAVNLVWRVSRQTVRVGELVSIELVAVSDGEVAQSVSGIDSVIGWDPVVLRLAGTENTGAHQWMGSWFPADAGLDGLNADCGSDLFCEPYTGLPYNDGNALYQAFAGWAPAQVTAEGLVVTTILFEVLAAADSTEVYLIAAMGDFTSTRVADGDPDHLGRDITGTLGSMALQVCGVRGDFDGDCAVGPLDVADFVPCLTGPDRELPGDECLPGDLDGDGDADLRDVAALQIVFVDSE